MADKDIDSDGSFESADEGDNFEIIGGEESSTKSDVSENVKKKAEETENTIADVDVGEDDDDTVVNVRKGLEEVDLNPSGEDRMGTDASESKEEQTLLVGGECRERAENAASNIVDSKPISEQSIHYTGDDKPAGQSILEDPESETRTDNSTNNEMEIKRATKEVSASPQTQAIDRTSDRNADPATGSQPSSSTHGSWGSWGGGWSGWGSSILTSASATVSAVSGSVGKVIENVESSLGVPKPGSMSPEDGSSVQKTEATNEEDSKQDKDKTASSPVAAVGSMFSYGASAITSVVGKTVSGGLDALEVIGKKTMDVLQDGDPGLKKKRAYLRGRSDAPNLSQLLREAKEDADEKTKFLEEEEERQKCHFGWLFELNQGLAHLEALEILSNESETRVESVVCGTEDDPSDTVKMELMEIKDAFELEDVESEEADESGDFVNTITEHLFSLSIAATPDKLKRVQTDAHGWLANIDNTESEGTNNPDAKEIHQKAMQVLADYTARSIEQFHKTGELLLLKQVKEENKSPIQQATSLSKLTSVLCAEVSFVASKFSEKLSKIAASSPDAETVNGYITNIFLEASNSTSYIQDAFQLLLPVMQVVALDLRDNS